MISRSSSLSSNLRLDSLFESNRKGIESRRVCSSSNSSASIEGLDLLFYSKNRLDAKSATLTSHCDQDVGLSQSTSVSSIATLDLLLCLKTEDGEKKHQSVTSTKRHEEDVDNFNLS